MDVQADCRGNDGRDQSPFADWSKIGKPQVALQYLREVLGDGNRNPCLSDTPSSRDCHETMLLEAILVEEGDPYVNPLGIKGVGEIGITGTAGAIANAVWHATGVRVRRFPITVEQLI